MINCLGDRILQCDYIRFSVYKILYRACIPIKIIFAWNFWPIVSKVLHFPGRNISIR